MKGDGVVSSIRPACEMDGILTGATPADLPMESPTNVELVVHKALGGLSSMVGEEEDRHESRCGGHYLAMPRHLRRWGGPSLMPLPSRV
jgi:hypothetical protein